MKLHALICAYNCADVIFECLESLVNVVDNILILDGKWIGYEGMLTSTDGTQDEIFRFMSAHPETPIGYDFAKKEMHQYEARQMLINQVPEDDWFVVIDTDEVVTNYPPMLKETLDIFTIIGAKGVKVAYAESPEIEPQLGDLPRFFRKTKGLHYTKNHRYLEDDEGPLNYSKMPYTREFKIIHMGKDKEMRPSADKYKHWLAEWELRNFS